MIKDTIIFLTCDAIIQTILFFILLYVIYLIIKSFFKIKNTTQCNQIDQPEHFDTVGRAGEFYSPKFREMYAVPEFAMINLKCKIDDIEYYLTNIDTDSESFTKNINKLPKDCSMTALILVPVSEVNENLEAYIKLLKKETKICAYSAKTNCLENLKNPTPEELIDCDIIPKSCKYNRHFTHDFKIKEIQKKAHEYGPQKYIFYGIRNIPQIGSSAPQSMINHELFYEAKPYPIPIICGDYYPYGAKEQNNRWGEIYVSEEYEENTGIIGLDTKLKIKLAFRTQITLLGKDIENNDIYSPCTNCDPDYVYSYIGYCKDSDNLDYKLASGKTYKRLCVIPSNLASTEAGSRILEFEPIIVK